MGKFGDYAASAGRFLADATREGVRRSIEDREIQAANEADERGKEILVEALLEVKQDDDTIIRMLHKYYGLNEDDAEQLIVGERTINIPCKTLETYLVRTEGFSRDEAYHYIVDSGIIDKLRENRTLWKKVLRISSQNPRNTKGR